MNISNLVDKYNTIERNIKALEKEQEDIKTALAGYVGETLEGETATLKITRIERDMTAWKAIAEKVGYSRQLKTANTKKVVYNKFYSKFIGLGE